jgi:conjugal transfer pilus assembly protein TraW
VIKKHLFWITLIVLVVIVNTPVHATIKNLGTFGKTYEIAEKDALLEIKDRADKVNWSKVFDKEKWKKKVLAYQPADLTKLPKARENRSRYVDMTYTLDSDIPMVDNSGNVTGVLYPKGYTFNPLDYAMLPNILVFFNGTNKNQLTWIKDSPYLKDNTAMFITTDGNWHKLAMDLKLPVYFARKDLVKKLQINVVPSVVYQEGNLMHIEEVNADEYVEKKSTGK